MQYRTLGRTGINVSRLCFGGLTVGPLQANLPLPEGVAVMRRALAAGVNFIDTAELYGTYPYIRAALREFDRDIVVVSKSYAYTEPAMRESVEKALRMLGRDYVDIFMLHEQESGLTIKGHWEAVEYLLKAREKGLVRAIGISTHHVEGVLGAAAVPEIDVIHPLFNIAGIGIKGGTAGDMLRAIKSAYKTGKGIYAMKALGGGHLLNRSEEAFQYVLSIPELASVAVGMSSLNEVDYNTRLFSGQPVEPWLRSQVARQPRRLCIEEWCLGCGECVRRCKSGALSLCEGKAVVNPAMCTLCGYCGPVCPDFCIKII